MFSEACSTASDALRRADDAAREVNHLRYDLTDEIRRVRTETVGVVNQAVALLREELTAEVRILHELVRQVADATRAHEDNHHRRAASPGLPNDDFYQQLED